MSNGKLTIGEKFFGKKPKRTNSQDDLNQENDQAQ